MNFRHPVPDYPLSTLGTVSKAYENEELHEKKHFVVLIYEAKNDKVVLMAYECPNMVLQTLDLGRFCLF